MRDAPVPFLVILVVILVIGEIKAIRGALRIVRHPTATMSFGPVTLSKTSWLVPIVVGHLSGIAWLWFWFEWI